MSKLEDIVKSLKSKKKIPFDGKQWSPGKLIIYLAKEVHQLRRNQCKPGMHCLFKYNDYIDETYGLDSGDQPLPCAFPAPFYNEYEDEE